ncbi:hypothetical protein OAF65_10780 [Verrucomicrobiales bacterium]|nr:hypothetical protein [Verrucomicrobiales bacterium]
MTACFLVGCGKEVQEESPDYVSLQDLNNRGVNGYYDRETKKLYTGEVRAYHSNETIEYKGFIKDGFREGEWIDYWDNENKQRQGYYKKGLKTGKVIHWHRLGKKKQETLYEDGVKKGKATAWWTDGSKSKEYTYSNGYAETVVQWYENGQKRYEFNTKNGERSKKYWAADGEQLTQFLPFSMEWSWPIDAEIKRRHSNLGE